MNKHFQPNNKSFKIPSIPKIGLPKFKGKLILKVFLVLIVIILVLASGVGLIYGRPAYNIYNAAKELQDSSYGLRESLKTQDLEQIELNLTSFQEDYEEFKQVYDKNSSRLKSLPYVKNYVADVEYLMNASDKGIELGFLFLNTLDPYAEELGLSGESNLTNEQKIQQLALVLPKLSEEVDEISSLMLEIDSELQKIDATKYPEEFRGVKVREQITSVKTVFSELANKSPKFKGLFEQLPVLIGVEEPKTYAVVMANSTELRMGSGGFPTYIVVVEVNNGIPTVVKSVDTYFIDVDNFILDNRNVPDYLYGELKVNRLYARDAINTSPDFVDGAQFFIDRYWNLHPGTGVVGVLPEVDGVIAVNTHLAEDLLQVLGSVDVKGRSFKTDQGTYKGFGDTEFNSENIIYNLEVIANSELSEIQGRKDIIRFLLESILNKVLNAKTENIIPLAQTFLEALGSKDIMVYSFDEEVQFSMEELNYSGRVRSVPTESWDYLYINHNNYGGGKRNWLVKTETSKETYREGGKNVSELSIKIENPTSPNWWESPWLYTYKDYVAVYVPEDSTLMSATLDSEEVEVLNYSDLSKYGKEVFDFRIWVEEGQTKTLNLKYELPSKVDLNDYNLLLQKQPGTHNGLYSVTHGDTEKRFTLSSDMELVFD